MRWAVDGAWVERAWRAAVADGPCAVQLRWVTPRIEFVHRGTADFAAGTARLDLHAAQVGEGHEARYLDAGRAYRRGDDGRWRETSASEAGDGRALVDDCFGLLQVLRTAHEPLAGDEEPHAASWRLDAGDLDRAALPSISAFGFSALADAVEWRGRAAADDLGRLVQVRVWAPEPGRGRLADVLATELEARLSDFGAARVEAPDRIAVRRGGLVRRLRGMRAS